MSSFNINPAVEDFLEKLYADTSLPIIMGIINATPDSFYADSRARGVAALQKALQFIVEGADVIDVGGESSRPGSEYISADEEISRVVPLIQSIRRESQIPISIDTRKAQVARAALEAGANIINDISALRDDEDLGKLAAENGIPVILMHMQGSPESMQKDPRYNDVIAEVRGFLQERIDYAQGLGIPCEHIIIDPGIGFGKSQLHNLMLLKNLKALVGMGYPVLMGHSRKSFIGRMMARSASEQVSLPADGEEIPGPRDRLYGSLAVLADSYYRGARIFRVHDVFESRQILDVCHQISSVGK